METLELKTENQLVKINASDYGLEESKAKEIEALFVPMLSKMSELENEYNDVLKEEINPETCQRAKDLRLSYVKIRTGTAEIHKKAKEFYLNGGRFVDGWKNAQLFASGEKEKTLKAIEDHFENQEKERFEKLRIERLELLKPYTEIEPLALGHMQQDVFDNYLTGVKIAHEQRIVAEKKTEEDRIENERIKLLHTKRINSIRGLWRFMPKENEEVNFGNWAEDMWDELVNYLNETKDTYDKKQEQTRIENIRLQKEAEEREKQIAIEREKIRKENEKKEKVLLIEKKKADKERAKLLAKIKQERIKFENIEAEVKRRKEADEKLKRDAELKLQAEQKAKAAEEKKAKLAPDKTKLLAFGQALNDVPRPEIKSIEAAEIMANINGLLVKLNNYIIENANKL